MAKKQTKTETQEQEGGAKKQKIMWGDYNYNWVTATLQLTSEACATRSHPTEKNMCIWPRDLKDNPYIPDGMFRGALRDSAPRVGSSSKFLPIPKTIRDNITIGNVELEPIKLGTVEYKGSPQGGGRGVVYIGETIPKGATIEVEFFIPSKHKYNKTKQIYNLKRFEEHLILAGLSPCGLGALRKQGYGKFRVVKLEAKNGSKLG